LGEEMYGVWGLPCQQVNPKTWREIMEKDCQAHKLNWKDAMDHNRWTKQIRDD